MKSFNLKSQELKLSRENTSVHVWMTLNGESLFRNKPARGGAVFFCVGRRYHQSSVHYILVFESSMWYKSWKTPSNCRIIMYPFVSSPSWNWSQGLNGMERACVCDSSYGVRIWSQREPKELNQSYWLDGGNLKKWNLATKKDQKKNDGLNIL